MSSNTLLTTVEAADFLAVSVAFLERDRWAGARIPFIRVGSRAVRYRLEDLEQFVIARRERASLGAVGADGAPVTAVKGAS